MKEFKVGGQEPQKTEQEREFDYCLRYARKDCQQMTGNGKVYDIRGLSGHGKDCLNKILPTLLEWHGKYQPQ